MRHGMSSAGGWKGAFTKSRVFLARSLTKGWAIGGIRVEADMMWVMKGGMKSRKKRPGEGSDQLNIKVGPFAELRRSAVEKAERGILPRPNCA